MEKTAIEYKFYILDKHNNGVSGVISEEGGVIVYHDLIIRGIFDAFQNKEVDQLTTFADPVTRQQDSSVLSDSFDKVEVTKDYWKAYEHAGGKKRKAIAENTEN